ncbi:MAG: hypothetical protein PHW79_08130 [Candidatus Marinimicrobia bacterium]|nr:hypothetical protein [Candidatus Neomarinimicrobiota bacterium]
MTNQRISCIFLILVLTFSSAVSQNGNKYYLTYDDFIRGLETPVQSVLNRPFYRAHFEQGKMTELATIDSTGSINHLASYRYGKSGNVSEVREIDSTGRLISLTSYLPDSWQKRLMQKKLGNLWKPSGNELSTRTLFDSTAKPIEHRIYSVNGEYVGKIGYSYDERGDLIEEIWEDGKDNSLLEKYTFSFDYADSIQTIEQFDANGKTISSVKLRILSK